MRYSKAQIEAASTPEELAAILAANGSSTGRWTVGTLTEVAEFFSVATTTVKGWRQESPPMPGSDGHWPLDEITRWRHSRLTGSDLATAQKEATLESTQLANDARRLELAKERGELLDRGDVERWAATALIEAREMLMQLPEMVAASAPVEIREFARAETDRHVRAVLTSLRRRLDELPAEETTVEADHDAD